MKRVLRLYLRLDGRVQNGLADRACRVIGCDFADKAAKHLATLGVENITVIVDKEGGFRHGVGIGGCG